VSEVVPLQGGLEVYGTDAAGTHVYIPANSVRRDQHFLLEPSVISQGSQANHAVNDTGLIAIFAQCCNHCELAHVHRSRSRPSPNARGFQSYQ
jgi:hypothetical protein